MEEILSSHHTQREVVARLQAKNAQYRSQVQVAILRRKKRSWNDEERPRSQRTVARLQVKNDRYRSQVQVFIARKFTRDAVGNSEIVKTLQAAKT